MKYESFVLIVFLLLAGACGNKPVSLRSEAYCRWIFDEHNGLSREKKINRVNIDAQLLPAEYLAYREREQSPGLNYDSLLKSYSCGLSFQLSLRAEKDDREYGNLMYYNVVNEKQFRERSRILSFNAEHFIFLESGGVRLSPVLTSFDGYDPMSNKVSFQVVFIVPEYDCGKPTKDFKNLTLRFEDPYWNLGNVNFEFKNEDIIGIPALQR